MQLYQDIADFLKAVAHPVRLQIIRVLESEGEACVCHLEACLDQRQAYISQHLAKLREAGLVVDRRDGLNVYYALAREDLPSFIETAGRLLGEKSSDLDSSTPWGVLNSAAPDCPCPRCETKQSTSAASAA
jgi:ArsR family transcriptional regulator